jgi:hypothetical protein
MEIRGFPRRERILHFQPWNLSGHYEYHLGRAVAQAVSRWFPTVAVQIRVRAACGVCGELNGNGVSFLRVLRFPLPVIIPPISPSS